jgi:hypothetical protein
MLDPLLGSAFKCRTSSSRLTFEFYRNTNLNARQPKGKRINGYWHNEACRQIAEAAAEYIEAS